MEIRDALKLLRNELHINQLELAHLLNVSNITVNRWENNKNTPSRSISTMLVELAKERGASELCMKALQETLFPVGKYEIDAKKFEEVTQISQLLEDSSNAVVVCDKETHEILYLNRQMVEMAGRTLEEVEEMKCYEYLLNRDEPCATCEKVHASTEEYVNFSYKSPRTGRQYLMRGKTIIWKGRPALIEYITDITDLVETQQETME